MMRRWRRFATLWWVYAMGCAAHLITTALAAATVRTIALGQSFSPWLPNWTALLLFGALCITVGAVPAIVQSEAERRWRARHGIEDARVHSARRTAVMTILVLLPFTAVCAIMETGRTTWDGAST